MMIKNFVNNSLKQLGRNFGLEIRRLKKTIGVMEGFLRHLRRPLDNALWAVDLAFVRQGGMFDTYKTREK